MPNPGHSDIYVYPVRIAEFLAEAALEMAKHQARAFRIERKRARGRSGLTLRPGRETPLWNALRVELRPHLRKYGTQAHLGRLLGLPRQRINDWVTGGGAMPDAERTLQLLAWLMARNRGRNPA